MRHASPGMDAKKRESSALSVISAMNSYVQEGMGIDTELHTFQRLPNGC
jgi:hypothetical protein